MFSAYLYKTGIVCLIGESMNPDGQCIEGCPSANRCVETDGQCNKYIRVSIALLFIAILSFITSYIITSISNLILSEGLDDGAVTILSTIVSLVYFLHISD